MSSLYAQKFNELVEAIKHLELFPVTIQEFTGFLKQRFLKKHELADLVWIERLSQKYEDSCKHYAEFIKRVVATQFLARCHNASESEQVKLITELKANINAAHGRLNRFLGETSKDEILAKIDQELSNMEAIQQKKDKTTKHLIELGNTMKEKVADQVGDVFAKFVGPLWDFVFHNASMAIKSDYEHEKLKEAVQNVNKNMPQLEDCIKKNRVALTGIDGVLDVFKVMLEKKNPDLEIQMMSIHLLQTDLENACDEITKKVKDLNK